MELKKILKQAELFRGMNDAQLGRIAAISQKQTLNDNAVVFEQGNDGDALYVVSTGQVAVRIRTSAGKTFEAIYLGEGQVFGEMALIDQGPRSATIAAVGDDTIIFRISIEDFTDLCTSDTGIGYILMRNIAQDLSFKLRHRDADPASK